MSLLEVFFLALGVSLDSLAISICKGIESDKTLKLAIKCGISFSFFQTTMPLVGFFLGQLFAPFIDKFDHFIVFSILIFFGINMLKEAFSKNKNKQNSNTLISILILSFASSFDSFAVGLTLAFFETKIVFACVFICVLTFFCSFFGVLIGKIFQKKHKKYACIFGGLILIILAFKILIEHLLRY